MSVKQIVKTKCNQHRILGYSYNIQMEMTCKGCGLPACLHETNSETYARILIEEQNCQTSA